MIMIIYDACRIPYLKLIYKWLLLTSKWQIYHSLSTLHLGNRISQLKVGIKWNEMKWNKSGFRPPLCTYRLNWARRTSWGWWDDWDDTVLQTQDSKFEPWRSEAEHATSRSRRLPIILTFTRGWGRNIFVSFKPPRPGTEPRTLAWKAAVLTTALGPPPWLASSKGKQSSFPENTQTLVYCRATVADDGPTSNQHWCNALCFRDQALNRNLVRIWYAQMEIINPSTAKLHNLFFHPLEVVSRCRDPQLQVGENCSYLLNFWPSICKS